MISGNGRSRMRELLPHPASFLFHHSQPLGDNRNKILYICHNGRSAETSSVQKLIYHEFIRIYGIQIDRTDLTVRHYTERRSHVACGNGRLPTILILSTRLSRPSITPAAGSCPSYRLSRRVLYSTWREDSWKP